VPLFVEGEEKCVRDGICVETCPRWLITLENHAAVPVPAKDAEELCIHCGRARVHFHQFQVTKCACASSGCAPEKSEF